MKEIEKAFLRAVLEGHTVFEFNGMRYSVKEFAADLLRGAG